MNYKLLLEKILWSLAPFAWGIFSWSIWKAFFIPVPLKLLIMAFVASTIIILFFGSTLNRALNYRLRFLDYTIPLPPWWKFLVLILLGVSVSFTPLFGYKLISSIVNGILIYSIFEEFITRSFFIKYKMDSLEFMLFNILSSLSFTFMHCFYGEGFIQSLAVGHFGFSFALGIIAYKTQRIELTIILHMLSNIVRYTIPIVIFDSPWPSLVGAVGNIFFEILFYLCLAGYSYSIISEER